MFHQTAVVRRLRRHPLFAIMVTDCGEFSLLLFDRSLLGKIVTDCNQWDEQCSVAEHAPREVKTQQSSQQQTRVLWRCESDRARSRGSPHIAASGGDTLIENGATIPSFSRRSSIATRGRYVSQSASWSHRSSSERSCSGCRTYGKCACKTIATWPSGEGEVLKRRRTTYRKPGNPPLERGARPGFC